MAMPEHLIQFDRLEDRLLRGGIAPRHVRRTLTELREHYDDAVRAEKADGLADDDATQAAWQRLGNENAIVENVLARPELRSLPARFPRLIFGAGPLVLWFGATFFTILIFVLILDALKDGALQNPSGRDPDWFRVLFLGLCFSYIRILPVVIGLGTLALAARQRLPLRWPVIGAVLISLFGGTSGYAVKFTETVGESGELEINNSLLPIVPFFNHALGQFQPEAFAKGVVLGIVNLAIILLPFLLWQKGLRADYARGSV